MEDYNTVIKTINFNVIGKMEDGADSYLSVDTILLEMALPATQLDPVSIPEGKEKTLFKSIQIFKKRINKKLDRSSKNSIKQILISDWLPTLPRDYKYKMIKEFGIVRDIDPFGYAIFDQCFYDRYSAIMHNQDPNKINRLVTYKKLNNNTPGVPSKNSNTLGGLEYKVYYPTCIDGYWSAGTHITEDQWYKIILDASPNIKRMLQCFLQLPEPYVTSCTKIEQLFGVNAKSINSCNIALGQRAQIMMGDISYQEAEEPHNERYWYYAMEGGYYDKETNTFIWRIRKEVIKAAARIAKEEDWKEVKLEN